MKISGNLIIGCIRSYQLVRPFLDAVFIAVFGVSSKCRQHPTCSDYTIQQIRDYGTITGLKKGISRLAKCHPYVGSTS